nr:MAG TPA: hypothetical protein [Bacteriophage sp.]
MRYNEREHACFFIACSRSIHIHIERGFYGRERLPDTR